jgi:hypothetical protein
MNENAIFQESAVILKHPSQYLEIICTFSVKINSEIDGTVYKHLWGMNLFKLINLCTTDSIRNWTIYVKQSTNKNKALVYIPKLGFMIVF